LLRRYYLKCNGLIILNISITCFSTILLPGDSFYSLRSEISVGDFVLSTEFVLSHRHLFLIGGSNS
jgi:hypothetical protein